MELLIMVWTKVNNATGDVFTKVERAQFASISSGVIGSPIGLLMALTYSASSAIVTDPWTHVVKASGDVWTDTAKAT